MFVERYIASVNSSDLRDDELHTAAEPLRAAAYADVTGCDSEIGSLLCRVKYADGSVHKLFEAGTANLAHLLRIWLAEVTSKGRARKWVKIGTDRDIATAHSLYKRVAEDSLAHWLDGRCQPCQGAGQSQERRLCTACAGSGKALVESKSTYERNLVLDMVSELEGLFRSHGSRARSYLRRQE